MRKLKIVFLDSGIGGIAVMNEFDKKLSNHQFIYFGDNDNAPYGSKSERRLKSITFDNIQEIMSYNPNAIVVACNTLSTNLLDFIKGITRLPVFPIIPPIERAIVRGENATLLCTPKTAERINLLLGNVKNNGDFVVVPLDGLAWQIETNAFLLNSLSIKETSEVVNIECNNLHNNSVILGCTHYIYLKNQILDYFCPPRIYDGIDCAIDNYKKWLRKSKLEQKGGFLGKNEVIFIGKCKLKNKKFWFEVVKNGKIIT